MTHNAGLVVLIAGGIFLLPGPWRSAAQQPAQQARTATPNPNFTGGTVTRIEEEPPAQIGYFHFDPGARTKWHVHDKGQLVFVEEGVGLAQEKGKPVVELHAGEAIWCPPGVAHWHGASPDKGGTQFNVSRGGIKWLDEVSQQEYTAKPVRK